jgi:hypothetical protein
MGAACVLSVVGKSAGVAQTRYSKCKKLATECQVDTEQKELGKKMPKAPQAMGFSIGRTTNYTRIGRMTKGIPFW